MDLPIPDIILRGPSASAVVLADRESGTFTIGGLGEALSLGGDGCEVDVRVFGKPSTRPNRRMAVALARSGDVDQAQRFASKAAERISISYA